MAGFMLLGLLSFQAYADVQRFSDFQYDEVGNIVHISSTEQTSPPDVLNIDPSFVNIGRTVTMSATGTDLLAAQVTTLAPGLSISSVKASKSEVTFNIRADQNAVLGAAIITFTTGLGSDSHSIIVAEPLPALITNPSPIIIAVNEQASLIQLIFSEPRPSQETYIISTLNPLTATASVSSLTVPSGATNAQFTLAGLALGTTTLNVVLAEKFYFFSFPVFVAENFIGEGNIFSRAVGILLQPSEGIISNGFLSQSVGVLLQTPDENIIGNPVLSANVGVVLETVDSSSVRPLLSPYVGIFLDPGDGSLGNPLLSGLVGVFTGAVISSYEPASLQAGDQTDILINGGNLNEITEIAIEPADIITINGFSAIADGSTLTVSVSIDPVAPIGDYQMIFTTVSPDEVTLTNGSRVILTID